MKNFLTKKYIYIGLFAILYLIVAFSSFYHACAFFGLANNDWMSIILALAFEIGQAAVLFSLLTSKKDRGRVMPWVLMIMFTLVQVIGNVFSSYKYIINNSVENLRYFKEPIFIWTDIPDDQATVIIVYLVGAILPIAALLLTSMITNYLTDQEELKEANLILESHIENGPETYPIELHNEEEFLDTYNKDDQKDNGKVEQIEDEKIDKEELHEPNVNITEEDNIENNNLTKNDNVIENVNAMGEDHINKKIEQSHFIN